MLGRSYPLGSRVSIAAQHNTTGLTYLAKRKTALSDFARNRPRSSLALQAPAFTDQPPAVDFHTGAASRNKKNLSLPSRCLRMRNHAICLGLYLIILAAVVRNVRLHNEVTRFRLFLYFCLLGAEPEANKAVRSRRAGGGMVSRERTLCGATPAVGGLWGEPRKPTSVSAHIVWVCASRTRDTGFAGYARRTS